MKRPYKISIVAPIVCDLDNDLYYALMHDVVYSKVRFYVLMDSFGQTETKSNKEMKRFKTVSCAVTPNARFLKVLLSWLNYSPINRKPERTIELFNLSFLN